MSALLFVILFVLGMVVALIVWASKAPQQRRTSSRGTKLDTTDDMFLWGEVADDEFYRM